MRPGCRTGSPGGPPASPTKEAGTEGPRARARRLRVPRCRGASGHGARRPRGRCSTGRRPSAARAAGGGGAGTCRSTHTDLVAMAAVVADGDPPEVDVQPGPDRRRDARWWTPRALPSVDAARRRSWPGRARPWPGPPCDLLGGTYGRRVVVISGKGNNGADGRVAAGAPGPTGRPGDRRRRPTPADRSAPTGPPSTW